MISTRTYNSLRYAGIQTVDDIRKRFRKPEDMLRLGNFGRKSLEEVSPLFDSRSGEDNTDKHAGAQGHVPVSRVPRLSAVEYRAAIAQSANEPSMPPAVSDVYSQLATLTDNAQQLLNSLFPHPEMLHSAVMADSSALRQVPEGASLTEVIDLRRRLLHFIGLAIEKLRSQGLAALCDAYRHTEESLQRDLNHFTCLQLWHHFVSPEARHYAEQRYEELCEEQLDTRAKNFRRRFLPRITDMLALDALPLADYQRVSPRKSITGTQQSIYRFNQDFCREFRRIAALPPHELHGEIIKHRYPFLTDADLQFVFTFADRHGHKPMLFILQQLLRHAPNRTDAVYSYAYGCTDNTPHSIEETAAAMHLSLERARQIALNAVRTGRNTTIEDADWAHYDRLNSRPVITASSTTWHRLVADEQLNLHFPAFAHLLALAGHFLIYDEAGITVLVNRSVADDFDTDNIFHLIHHLYHTVSLRTLRTAIDTAIARQSEKLRPTAAALYQYLMEHVAAPERKKKS